MDTEPVAVARGGLELVALVHPPGRCQLREHINGLEQEHPTLWKKVTGFYWGYLPNKGLPVLVETGGSRGKAITPSRKVLYGGVEEFRLSVRRRFRDPWAYRALYFRDGVARLVIVTSHVKPLPRDAIEHAVAMRQTYLGSRMSHDEGTIQ